MKKLFDNTIFKSTFVLVCVALACALLIALINLVAAPAIADGQKQREINSYKRIFSDMADYQVLYMDEILEPTDTWPSGVAKRVTKALDTESELVGYIFTVTKSNSYGNISLVVGIGADKLIGEYIEILENGQTSGRNAQVVKQIVEFYGVNYLNIGSVQNVGTNATRAFETITDIMNTAGEAFEITLKIDNNSSGNITKVLDETFVAITEGTVEIQAKFNLIDDSDTVVGYVYQLVNNTLYQEGVTETADVAFEITVSLEADPIIEGYEILTASNPSVSGNSYDHSKGTRLQATRQYLDSMVGKALSVVVGYDASNIIAGATYSQNAVLEAIKVLAGKLGGNN